jgi:hypothetical protein
MREARQSESQFAETNSKLHTKIKNTNKDDFMHHATSPTTPMPPDIF